MEYDLTEAEANYMTELDWAMLPEGADQWTEEELRVYLNEVAWSTMAM
jgi:hypothetical protein